jgi:hypothetical protein
VAILPHKAAILHCKGHQKDYTFISISHNLVDITAKQAAQKTPPPGSFYQLTTIRKKKEVEVLKTKGVIQHKGYWFLNNTLVLTEQQIKPILTALHPL